MLRTIFAAAMLAAVLPMPAHARDELAALRAEVAALKARHNPQWLFFASVAVLPTPEIEETMAHPVLPASPPRTISSYRDHIFKAGPRADLSRAPQELKDLLDKVGEACGEVVAISGYRPGATVRGTGKTSLHASGRAIDYQVADTACALKAARGWRGGHTTDYYAVWPNHFHISWAPGSREFGRRFTHYGGKTYAQRVASKKRYAKRKKRTKYAKRHNRRAEAAGWHYSAAVRDTEHGIASHYGRPQAVACGGRLDPQAMTAAHRTLPCGARVTVTNLANGRSVEVRINDRGPFIAGRIIDVTPAVARELGFRGLARVTVKPA